MESGQVQDEKYANEVDLDCQSLIVHYDDIRYMETNTRIVLQHDSFYLTWRNLSYSIKTRQFSLLCKKEEKSLLIIDDISGYAKSGECLAIMGSSGAGKSVLLSLLADRIPRDNTTSLKGEVKLNKEFFTNKKFHHMTGFVMQSDYFFADMKVKEIFEFIVDLKYKRIRKSERDQISNKMLKSLKLEHIKDNYIGGMFRKGISGGEKRRVNIGAELLPNPKILFLDEPTSGLDSYTAFVIIRLLKNIASEHNMLIIYSIHQPTIDIFQLFDNLMILNKGKSLYFGKASNVLKHYSSFGVIPPLRVNPIQFILDISLKGSEAIINQLLITNKNNVDILLQSIQSSIPSEPIRHPRTKANAIKQFRVLYKRAFWNYFRSPKVIKTRAIQTLMLTLVFMLLYFQIDDIDPSNPISLTDRFGAFFFISVNLFMTNFGHTVLLCKLISPY